MSMASTARATNAGSEAEMRAWKRLAAEAAAADAPLHLHFFGSANQIIGYRAYYMLQYAKKAGVRHLTLHTDGGLWIDEATDWLIDSGVDEIVLHVPGDQVPPNLQQRIDDLTARPGRRPAVVLTGTPAPNR